MAPPVARVAAPGAAEGPPQQPAFGFSTVLRFLAMGGIWWYMSQAKSKTSSGEAAERLRPAFPAGHMLKLDVFLSSAPGKPEYHLWSVPDVRLAERNFGRHHEADIDAAYLQPPSYKCGSVLQVVTANETLYLVARFTDASADAAAGQWRPVHDFTRSASLIRYLAPKKDPQVKKLLGSKRAVDGGAADGDASESEPGVCGSSDDDDKPACPAVDADDSSLDSIVADGASLEAAVAAADVGEAADGGTDSGPAAAWVPHWKSNLTISMVNEFGVHLDSRLPPAMAKHAKISHTMNVYEPIIHIDEFWLLKDYLVPLNATTGSVRLRLDVNTISSMWWQFQGSLDDTFALQQSRGLMGEKEVNELKRVFLEGNPYFLMLTFLVSMLHSVFDALAFKNDIGFWKANTSMEGLSARTVGINAVCQIIIFFYLVDSETSMVVLGSAGIGALIEIWKVTKVMNVTLEQRPGKLLRLVIKDRQSYIQTNTKTYDDEAMRYLSIVLFPCIVGYFIYSLVYHEYKSWYSFVLQTLVGCVYAFGFVLMCPQLYLNYKLKSVAHLPWRQMTYKFLNTIVDDLFAFVIKMPILHRLAVFRDDLVFLVYIYQRWIYRVDKSRVNEFGFSDAPPPGAGNDAPAALAGAAEDPASLADAAPSGPSQRIEGSGASQTGTPPETTPSQPPPPESAKDR